MQILGVSTDPELWTILYAYEVWNYWINNEGTYCSLRQLPAENFAAGQAWEMEMKMAMGKWRMGKLIFATAIIGEYSGITST